MFNKQTYSLSVLIISLNVKWEVKEELTMICFVHFIWATAMIWLLMRTHVFRLACAHTVPCSYCETEVYVQRVRGICVCCVLQIGINRVTHRGYRVLRRTHMFGLRVATKPCLQKHLYEPAVFTQRAFLHGLTRAAGSAHSSMSEKNKRKHWSKSSKKGNKKLLNCTKYKVPKHTY